MSRTINKLTNAAVRSAKSGRHGDGGGLYLKVTATGARSWLFMWKPKGASQNVAMGLGAYPAIALAKARERASECRRMVAEGVDPRAERDKELEPIFSKCVELFLDDMESEWSNAKHRYQWRQTLGPSYCKKIEKKRVSEIAMADVLAVLKPIWNEKTETATRLRGRIERVLNFAKVKGWREGENPAAWRGNLENVLPKPKKLKQGHLPAMPYVEVPNFIEELVANPSLAARALELTIYTASRTGEVLGARWMEIDLEARTWTIPPERMKARKEHCIPLSDASMAVLEPLNQLAQSEWVFPGQKPGKPLSIMAMEMLLRRMNRKDITVHGFRSSFRDWTGDQTNFQREVAEGCLARMDGNAVERSYRRSTAIEKRRRLLSAWAEFVTGAKNEKVVSLHG